MKRYLLLLVLLSFTISVYCQQITFQKTYGGTSSDVGLSIQQTTDGGYVIIGNTTSFGAGDADVYLIKADVNGDIIWTKTFGGVFEDVGYSVQQTTDGGYILVGYTLSFGIDSIGNYAIYLIKTDTNGDVLWNKTYGGMGGEDWGNSVQQTTDGGYIVAGHTNDFGAGYSAIYLIKTDANGDSLWTKAFGGPDNLLGWSVEQTIDEGYIITGYTYNFSSGGSDVYLIKTDTSGNSVWTKRFHGTNIDQSFSVHQTTDGGYILAGETNSFGAGSADVYLIKTDSIGDTLWTKTYGGINGDIAECVQQTTDEGYIIIGTTASFGGGYQHVYLIKTDANGDTLWTKIFGEAVGGHGIFGQQISDGGYIITGISYDFGAVYGTLYLIKTDSMGNSGCYQGSTATIVSSAAPQVSNPTPIVFSGGNITTPTTIVGGGGINTTFCTTVGIPSEINNPKSEIAVSPNPFTSEFAVQSSEEINQIVIYDLIGATVYQQELPSNKTSAALNLSFLQQGVYFLNVKATCPVSYGNGESWTRKIVKM